MKSRVNLAVVMVQFFTVVVAVFSSVATSAMIVEPGEYGFKYSDPLLTTIAAGAIYQESVKGETLKVPVLERRVDGYRGNRRLLAQFYSAGKDTSELLIIISGLGATKDSNLSVYLAQLGLKAGKSVVTIPNTFTEDFVISSSRNGIVGNTQKDVKDLYQALIEVKKELLKKGYQFNRSSIVGYSHGGLLAAHVAEMDQSRLSLNVISTLMINPPVDLLYGMNQLDAMESKSKNFSQVKLLLKALSLQKLFKKYRDVPTTDESFEQLINSTNLNPVESAIVIGKVLMHCLGNTIIAGQAFNDLGLLPEAGMQGSVGQRYQDRARKSKANSFNFNRYLNTFIIGNRNQYLNVDINELNYSSSLLHLRNFLQENQNIFVMHNSDDFLLQDGDVNWLQSTFSERAVIYPRGGHMGNLWYPENVAQVNNWLINKKLKNSDALKDFETSSGSK